MAARTKNRISQALGCKEFISGETLAAHLHISRQALHKQIQILRSEGYLIDGKSNLGYQLISKPDKLFPEALERSKIFYFSELTSTQDKAKELANLGEKEGTLVLAEKQTAGRGRLGRSWSSEKGGLWFSLLLRPALSPQKVPLLSLAASVAVARAIESIGSVSCGLKWPNDVVLKLRKNQCKKVCGILVEMSSESDRVNWIVLGCGINANNILPASLKESAISLREFTQSPIDRTRLLKLVVKEIEGECQKLVKDGFAPIRKEYLRRSILKGKKIALCNLDQTVEGQVVTINSEGLLVLKTSKGSQEKFSAGEVTLNVGG